MAGCSGGSHGKGGGADAGGISNDMQVNFNDDASAWMGPCDNIVHPCAMGGRCLEGACIPDNGTCLSDSDCQNDTWCSCQGGGGGDAGPCVGGVCVAWGTGARGVFDPDCSTPGFSAAQFVPPKLKCSWTGAGVMSSTFVADLDGDHVPEIIAMTLSGTLVALHGKDCSLFWQRNVAFSNNEAHLAIADLDNDKKPEIVVLGSGAKVQVYDNMGMLLASSPTPFAGSAAFGGPAIADVDNQAPPEILAPGQVLRYLKGNAVLTVLWTINPGPLADGLLPLAADFDGDKKPEVVQGRHIYDGITGKEKTPPGLLAYQGAGAFSAVGDFNGDKSPDLVIVQNFDGPVVVTVYDVTHDKLLFGPYSFGGQRMGAPTVADFDGDGKPEFATAGADAYRVFSLKCVGKNRPAQCDPNTEGVLWSKVTQDKSSGVTGSSVFDFNGDGKAEVIYRDECWLRVYNGPDGKTLFATTVSSYTALEEPVIADIDNDGHAEIIVSSDSSSKQCPGTVEADTKVPFAGYTDGIFVFKDPLNRWMPSRAVWNQHTYHITNINDDLSVPTFEKPNWLTLNNYRMNVQGMGGKPLDVADETSGVAIGIDTGQGDCMTAWTLRANVCNRGTADLPAAFPGTFYPADPRMGNPMPICTATTVSPVAAGQCETVSCDWKNPPLKATDLWFRGNDDAQGTPPIKECKPLNDLLYLPSSICRKIM